MPCTKVSIFAFDPTANLLPYLTAYTILTAVFNTTGSSLLLWVLKKTGQTSTISFQFIIMMSISDLIGSISNATILTLITWKKYNMSCWVSSSVRFLLGTLNTFSFFMIVLIALDRYLHMKYLERYHSIFTKRRGHLVAAGAFFIASIINGILLLPLPKRENAIMRMLYVISLCPFLLCIFILYRGAMRALTEKSSQLTSRIITQTRTLSKTAKMVTICITGLTIPFLSIQAIELADGRKRLMSSTLINNMKPFAYVTYTFNVFCNSIIFMSQNRPIRMLIKRRCPQIRRRSLIRPIEANMQNAKAAQRVFP